MKKTISIILTLVMLFSCVNAYALTPEYDASWAKMGDINLDNRVTAMDARLVLRYSAKLDKDEMDPYRADADGNGKLNAADAREILRVAAGMSQFVCGFDGNRVPCVINTLKSGRFYMEASYDETGSGKGKKTQILLAKDSGNIYFINKSDDVISSDTTEDSKMPKILGVGMLLISEQMYAVMLSEDADFAIPITDALIEAMGKDGDLLGDDLMIDAELLKKTSDLISEFVADDIGAPTKVTVNDKECFCYSYTNNGKQFLLYVDSTGRIMNIDCVNSKGDNLNLIEFTKVSGDKPTAYFDLDNYAVLELF